LPETARTPDARGALVNRQAGSGDRAFVSRRATLQKEMHTGMTHIAGSKGDPAYDS